MKKFVFFDLANTLYRGYSASDLYLFVADKLEDGQWIKDRHQKMYQDYSSKKTDYTEAARIATLLSGEVYSGMSPEQVRKLEREFMSADKLFSHVVEMIDLFKTHGFDIYIVSADTIPSVEAVADHLKIENYFCSNLEVVDNRYTGKVLIDLNNQEKQKAIQRVLKDETEDSISFAFGDSTGDIDMLSSVDHPFVFQPHQDELIKVSKEKNWQIVDEENILESIKQVLRDIS